MTTERKLSIRNDLFHFNFRRKKNLKNHFYKLNEDLKEIERFEKL